MIQQIRGTKDILPDEISVWQHIHTIANQILNISNYQEIRTPILENTNLFERVIGNETDIINKEMYTFKDKGNRHITLRPEGTASIARSFIENKLYVKSNINRLWYLGPMFRYERPQRGRQRQFHQLGIECIGSANYMADVEVIRLAVKILECLKVSNFELQINSIGNREERTKYKEKLLSYLKKYTHDLDEDSKKRLNNNPLRILDSKNKKTQEILFNAPTLQSCLGKMSLNHFYNVCKNLTYLNTPYTINYKLVRGLDYYNYTAFEIKTIEKNDENTICGGGRYDTLIEELEGPKTPAVGWAIGLERLIIVMDNDLKRQQNKPKIYLIMKDNRAEKNIWDIIHICEKNKINFLLDLNNTKLSKQLKKAHQVSAKVCIILDVDELKDIYCKIKWLSNGYQETININQLENYLKENKNLLIN
uniref:Histidine--tRNA ligase, chloroplastic n=1 Tax=Platysiphonia delicata TaxID=2006979 RepID=A0A1Z1M1C1_9FLOR|nr:Histidine-tRNA ligase [Platysiphonia delicata]ARW59682.1 Histidine-tRNA ligase [Platysiphonia delicata]